MVEQFKQLRAERSFLKQVFIGLDVHKTKWSVSIYEGQEHKQTYSMEPKSGQLIKKLKKKYPGWRIKLCYEAGFCGFCPQRDFESAGYECLVIHAADIPSTNFNKRRKSDSLDSKHLGLMLSRGLLSSIYVPSKEQEEIRSIVRLRLKTSKDRRREMNRIRAFINCHGLELPAELPSKRLWTKQGHNWLQKMGQQYFALKKLYEAYQFKRNAEKEIRTHLRERIKNSSYQKVYEVLLSAPGVGPCTASLLIAELGGMLRFKNLDKLASYCGLVPDVRSSADKVKVLGVTSRGNKRIRTALIEAAWIAQRVDPKLHEVYLQGLEKGRPKQSIIVKIARKLLSRLRAIWIKQQEYQLAA